MGKFLLVIRKENKEENNLLYMNAIKTFGGEVVTVYDSDSYENVGRLLKYIDGILLPGGDDVGRLDFFLIEYALMNKKKLLGICQGMQSMALYGSGDKLVSIEKDNHYLKDKYCHDVIISDNSMLYKILGKTCFSVNSYHHQTILKSYFFSIIGYSSDGLIEVVEGNDDIFQIGVQWHPERMFEFDDNAYKLLESFIKK